MRRGLAGGTPTSPPTPRRGAGLHTWYTHCPPWSTHLVHSLTPLVYTLGTLTDPHIFCTYLFSGVAELEDSCGFCGLFFIIYLYVMFTFRVDKLVFIKQCWLTAHFNAKQVIYNINKTLSQVISSLFIFIFTSEAFA